MENIKSKFTNSLYFEILKQYKIFDGRISRNEYWFFILINISVSIILSFLWNPLGIIFQLFVFVPTVAASVRRIQDLNKEFWYLLIPVYDLYLLFQKGTNVDQANLFGPPTKDSKIKINTVFVLIFITVFLFISKSSYDQYQIKRAKERREALYTSNDTGTIKAEIDKLTQISLQEIAQAETIDQIVQAYWNAPRGSQAQLTAALKWVDLCQTSREIKEADSYFSEFSEARAKALVKWQETSKKEIEQAQTIQAAKEVYDNAPEDNDLKTLIYNKWNELSLQIVDQIQTVKEAKEAYDNSPIGSQARTKILEKWQETSQKEIDQVSNFGDMKLLFSNLPDDSNLKNSALIKWISFCQTVLEIKQVYSNAIDKSEPQRLALAKWKEIYKQEIDQTQDLQKTIELYNNLLDDDKLKSTTLFKWISLSQTAKEVKEVYSHTLNNSEERKSAFDKWNTLSLQEIEKAKTLEEVRQAYNNTPENSQARDVATQKLKELQ